ncbi:MAG: hypothetical protein ABIQ90_16180 [Polaromonas sp.]
MNQASADTPGAKALRKENFLQLHVFVCHARIVARQFKTPNEVYASGVGGGALIVDRFPPKAEEPQVVLCSSGTLCAPTNVRKANSKPGQRRPVAVEIEDSLD